MYTHYYVIYNICIMHINSNKCICVISENGTVVSGSDKCIELDLLLICGFNDFFRQKDV